MAKHSYRSMAKRTFNALILAAITDPERIDEQIKDYFKTRNHCAENGQRYMRLVSARDTARKLKSGEVNRKFYDFGQFAPYVKEITDALKSIQGNGQLSIF